MRVSQAVCPFPLLYKLLFSSNPNYFQFPSLFVFPLPSHSVLMRIFIPTEVCVWMENGDGETTSWALVLPLDLLSPSICLLSCSLLFVYMSTCPPDSWHYEVVTVDDCCVWPECKLHPQVLPGPNEASSRNATLRPEMARGTDGGEVWCSLGKGTGGERKSNREQIITPNLTRYMAIHSSNRCVTNEICPPLLWK